MTLSWKRAAIAIPLVAVGISVLFFQNCSMNGFGTPQYTVLSINHPSTESDPKTSQLTSKVVMGDWLYLESVFSDVFTPANPSQSDLDRVRYYLNLELQPTVHLLGRACDITTTAEIYSSCYGTISNSQLAMDASTSSAREAAKLQTCRRMTNDGATLAAAVNKVKGDDPTPNASSIAGVIRLFYPAMDAASVREIQAPLQALDTEMAKSAERVDDRWRVLVLSVCESAGWELL